MIYKVFTPNHVFEENMEMIEEIIVRNGSCSTVMCCEHDGAYYCLEGSHRIYYHQLDEVDLGDLYLMTVPKDHRFYMGYDNNYFVSEENASQWVKDDLTLCVAWEVIEQFTNKKEYSLEGDGYTGVNIIDYNENIKQYLGKFKKGWDKK